MRREKGGVGVEDGLALEKGGGVMQEDVGVRGEELVAVARGQVG